MVTSILNQGAIPSTVWTQYGPSTVWTTSTVWPLDYTPSWHRLVAKENLRKVVPFVFDQTSLN